MKILNFKGTQLQAEKIIKTTNEIIGKDINDKEIFHFKGISDFSIFTLANGESFDTVNTITLEKNRADIDFIAMATGVIL